MSFDESKVKRGRGDKGGEFVDKDGIPNNDPPSKKKKGEDMRQAMAGEHGGLHYDKEAKQWLNRKGEPIDEETLARLKKIGASAGYVSVSLNPDPNAHLQAWVINEKGNVKRLYTKEHGEESAAEKFARLKDFDAALPSISAGIAQDLNNTSLNPRQRDTNAALRLIEKTGLRPGSEKGESDLWEKGKDPITGKATRTLIGTVKTYGVTTLEGQHVTLGPKGQINVEFLGKSGKINTRSFTDPQLSKYLSQKNLTAGQRVFSASEDNLNARLKSLGGKEFKVKDFRTWQGTSIALREIAKMGQPTSYKEYADMRNAVAIKVSDFLNNTPSVALANYIDPHVFSTWGTFDPPPAKRKKKS